MNTTIVLPVSRPAHLQKIFASLELLECDRANTNLFVYVDGDTDLYLTARNLTEQSKFAQRLCVLGEIPGDKREYSINVRRRRISAIHNAIRAEINPCNYVFLIEDDGILPPEALSQLKADYRVHPHAGFIQGVELGRWGIPMVGAWRADDVYEPTKLETVLQETAEVTNLAGQPVSTVARTLVEQVDAGGLYCCLTKYEHYRPHEFKPFDREVLGPDVNYGIALRRGGYKNYIDWSVQVEHKKADGSSIHPRSTTPVRIVFSRDDDAWKAGVE